MQGSKLARARNKSDLWPKYVAWHANRTTAWRRVGSGAPTAVQDALRTPPAPSWNCGPPIWEWEPPAGKICGYKDTRCLVVLDPNLGGGGKIGVHIKGTWWLEIYADSSFGWRHDIHAEICTLHHQESLCVMHGRPNQRSRGAKFECMHT